MQRKERAALCNAWSFLMDAEDELDLMENTNYRCAKAFLVRAYPDIDETTHHEI